ncbi:MAG: hypothetical protein WBA17_17980, partial [Saprospiraceae bacterium]
MPYVKAAVQPTELIFVLLFVGAIRHYGRRLIPSSGLLQMALGLFVVSNYLSALYSGSGSALLEAVGRTYLVAVFLIVRIYVVELGPSGLRHLLLGYLAGALITCLIGLIGWLLAAAGWTTDTVNISVDYPYLGTVIRAGAFAGGPGMLSLVLLLPSLFAWRAVRMSPAGKLRKIYTIALCVLVAVNLLTFSKEFLLLMIGLAVLEPVLDHRPNVRLLILAAGSVLLWLGTHFIIQPLLPVNQSEPAGTAYSSQKVVYRTADWQVLESSYFSLKQAGLAIGAENPWLGVGPGRFNEA